MKYVKAQDSYDLDEEGNPKDLSYQAGAETTGIFPVLKVSPEYVPVGDIDSYCVHLAWRYKDEKHSKTEYGNDDGSFKPFGG